MYTDVCVIHYGFRNTKQGFPAVWEDVKQDLWPSVDASQHIDHVLPGRIKISGLEEGIDNGELRGQVLKFACAVSKAYAYVESVPKLKAGTVLKVLAAPEFFFQPAVKNAKVPARIYNPNDYTQLAAVFKKLFSDPLWKDWAIIPGSVLYRHDQFMGLNAENDVYLAMNGTFIISGGEERLTTYTKRNASENDGIPTDFWPQNLQQHNPLFGDVEDTILKKPDGTRIGVEICKDHAMGMSVLKDTMRQVQKDASPYEVDVHVLIAANQPMWPTSIAARTGGYFVRVDGGVREYNKRYTIAQVTEQKYNDIETVQRMARLNDNEIRKFRNQQMQKTGKFMSYQDAYIAYGKLSATDADDKQAMKGSNLQGSQEKNKYGLPIGGNYKRRDISDYYDLLQPADKTTAEVKVVEKHTITLADEYRVRSKEDATKSTFYSDPSSADEANKREKIVSEELVITKAPLKL